jgi:hypothetical protein
MAFQPFTNGIQLALNKSAARDHYKSERRKQMGERE